MQRLHWFLELCVVIPLGFPIGIGDLWVRGPKKVRKAFGSYSKKTCFFAGIEMAIPSQDFIFEHSMYTQKVGLAI